MTTERGSSILRWPRRAERGRRTHCQPGVDVESRPERGRGRRPGARLGCLARGRGEALAADGARPGVAQTLPEPRGLGEARWRGSPFESFESGDGGAAGVARGGGG